MKKCSISIIVPCFGRPQSTRLVLSDIHGQTVSGWQLIMVGDGCPFFEEFIKSTYFKELKNQSASRGNEIIAWNLERNFGGWGYEARNRAITVANRDYLIFVDNDDRIAPFHLENYYYNTMHEDIDICLHSTLIGINQIRIPQLKMSHVGNSEIIVRTSIAKQCLPIGDFYGHDWDFIVKASNIARKVHFDRRNIQSYYVSRLRHDPEAC